VKGRREGGKEGRKEGRREGGKEGRREGGRDCGKTRIAVIQRFGWTNCVRGAIVAALHLQPNI
jgi:flagellar biosynthesis/type III secretory pathway protein FliH